MLLNMSGLFRLAILYTANARWYSIGTVPHWADGFGSSDCSGTEVMCRLVHDFFYALTFIMVGGVCGGCKACRTQSPVYQPHMSSTAQSLVASVGGLKLLLWSSLMNTQIARIAPNTPYYIGARHGI